MPAARRLVDQVAAAEYLGTTERHIRELKYRREIPFVKVGGKLRFDVRDLDLYVEQNKVSA